MRTAFNCMRIYFSIIACIGLVSCNGKNEKVLSAAAKDTANYTSIKWIDSVKNIGNVEAGKKAEIKFRFKNTGGKPLYIISAEPGCGCTVADFPKEAIAPGAEGLITANYDVHAGSEGEFRKNIHVTTNTKGSDSHYIFFYGGIKKDSSANEKVAAEGSVKTKK